MAGLRLNLPWRRPATEAGPINLAAGRLYVLPTRMGLVFGLLLLALLMVSVNYGISLGYLFTFLMAGIGIVSLFHSQRNLVGLALRPLATAPVFAGEQARFRLAVENRAGRARPGLCLEHAELSSGLADLDARSTASLDLDVGQPVRGWHRLDRLTLSSTWPLGLFRCWAVFKLDWGVLVYPKPAANPLPFPEPAGDGRALSWRRPGEDEFAALREYRPGDSPRRIAWKSVARGLPPLTKQFAGAGAGETWLRWQDCPESDVEGRLSRLARWALDASAQDRPWGLELANFRLPPGRGERHLQEALAALARHA
ncbi:DUF58 domain-containing protein [Parasulfuritortus cantonensis]|uniref:DUF58 domain-containing protein n=1 Tax=Parasulfuritortus cantonensis TaxID=2528202 RepID=A0A4R1BKW5_9PROT|nr:DUF58 domain-containing protein [Parasulfuritortus cantonensis]TCJ18040.1 DUF58 domain-containing protein [Parasulfuritortus cantonensis]